MLTTMNRRIMRSSPSSVRQQISIFAGSMTKSYRRGLPVAAIERDFSSSSNTNRTDDDFPAASADVVQGPSLLRTPVSRPSPSLMFLPGLRSVPFWTSREDQRDGPRKIAFGDPVVSYAVQYLESHVETIRDEYLRVAPTLQSDYDTTGHSDTLHDGRWDWHSYMSKGSVQGHFAFHFPQTATIINDGLRGSKNTHLLFEGTPFGFAFFSTLHGDSKIAAHTAPMNLRLRIHLPLIVPTAVEGGGDNDGLPQCGIRVGPVIRPWVRDSALVLDDSYDHEVWNTTSDKRVVLLVDIWHPDITLAEKEAVVGMFQKAKDDGLWKR